MDAGLELNQHVNVALGPEVVAEMEPKSARRRMPLARQNAAIRSRGILMPCSVMVPSPVPLRCPRYDEQVNAFPSFSACGHYTGSERRREARPLVQVIDDWNRNRRLARLFECKVGRGSLLVCSADLHRLTERSASARQLYRSLLD